MRINKMTAVALMILVLIVLQILFFAWTDEETRGAVEWMSYGFTMFAFVMACWSVFRVRQDSNEVYHLTTNYLPVSYFVVQTILSAIAIYYGMVLRKTAEVTQTITETVSDAVNESVGKLVATYQPSFLAEHYTIIVLSVYLLVLVFYAINLGIHSTANQATAESLAKQEEEHKFIQENSKLLQRLLIQIKEPTAQKAVNSLYETIRFSANHTSSEDKQIQNEIAVGISQLASLVEAANWDEVKELSQQLNLKAQIIQSKK